MEFTKVQENLEKIGYSVSEFTTKEEATDYLVKEIKGVSVGFGGSVTLQEMGVYDRLAEDNEVLWHWRVPEGQTPDEIHRKAALAEVYLSSVNGLAQTGEIINIDGTGNRVAATIFGHKKLYLIVGENKIAPTYEEALYRARNVAAPKNARRLNRNTPCVQGEERCYDCKSPERICNVVSVFWRKPGSMDVEVVLIHENLGY